MRRRLVLLTLAELLASPGCLRGGFGARPEVDQAQARDAPIALDLGYAESRAAESRAVDRGPADLRGADRSADAQLPADTTSSPCASGSPGHVFSSTMVICGSTSTILDQCSAEQRCNLAAGWHLCTATEYLAGGGATSAPPSTGAWIAACIRAGGAPFAPVDGVCQCATLTMANAGVEWSCSGGDPSMTSAGHSGVRTWTTCRRVGANSAASAAYWAPDPSVQGMFYAVCCR